MTRRLPHPLFVLPPVDPRVFPTLEDDREPIMRPPYAYPNPGPLSGEMYYPGDGNYPPNPGEARPGGSPFGRLAKGQPLGKSTTLLYNAEVDSVQSGASELLRIEGDDLDACQMIVTLAPPQVIQQAFDDLPIDFASSPSAGYTNAELTTSDFPGETDPFAWAPLEAVVEWGVKGTQHKAIVDFVNGVTFSVTASFLLVSVMVSQNTDAEVTGTSAAYVLAGCIGPGFSAGNARRTVFVETLDNTEESGTFDVPRFATRAYLLSRDSSVTPQIASAFVRFWRSPDGQAGGKSAGQVFVNSNQPQAFDIPNGAGYFSVYNQGSEMPFAVVFELSLQ